MTNNKSILKSIDYFEEPHRIHNGNKSFVLLAHGKGSLRVKVLHPAQTYISLKEVLYVPELMKNLLSVCTMTEKKLRYDLSEINNWFSKMVKHSKLGEISTGDCITYCQQ